MWLGFDNGGRRLDGMGDNGVVGCNGLLEVTVELEIWELLVWARGYMGFSQLINVVFSSHQRG